MKIKDLLNVAEKDIEIIIENRKGDVLASQTAASILSSGNKILNRKIVNIYPERYPGLFCIGITVIVED